MTTKTLDRRARCVKCGFYPTLQKEWKLEYKAGCKNYGYNKDCDWNNEVDEHIHQECPECGYAFPVACADHASVAPDKWTTGQTVKPVAPTPTNVTPIIKPATGYTYTPPKPAKCGKCPVDVKSMSEG